MQQPLCCIVCSLFWWAEPSPSSVAAKFLIALDTLTMGQRRAPSPSAHCVRIHTPPKGARPLRRSRARFPFLSPAVTSSPGAGEVFPQRESQGLRLVAEVLSAMRNLPGVLLPLPLGEVASRSDDGEGACNAYSSAFFTFTRHLWDIYSERSLLVTKVWLLYRPWWPESI